MGTNKYLLIILVLLVFSSCGDELPKSYGVYITSDHNLNLLQSQNLIAKGNLYTSISGLKSASGSCFNEIDNLLVYENDINPKELVLSKLQFRQGVTIPDILGSFYIDVNLWSSEKDIKINISPVENRKDMYKIVPTTPLDTGFYALHYGGLTNNETLNSFHKIAYDFVLGTSIDPYQSSEEQNQRNEQVFSANAEILLKKINDYFNEKNYSEIRKIYLNSDNSTFTNPDWDSLVEGFKNWYTQSGEIMSSTIISKRVTKNSGTFILQTEYEKVGIVNEELRIDKVHDSYFITFIGTK